MELFVVYIEYFEFAEIVGVFDSMSKALEAVEKAKNGEIQATTLNEIRFLPEKYWMKK